jgi:hypothetical protein
MKSISTLKFMVLSAIATDFGVAGTRPTKRGSRAPAPEP